MELKPLTTFFSSVEGEALHRFIGHISGANMVAATLFLLTPPQILRTIEYQN